VRVLVASHAEHGFTLVELVVTLILIGILAVAVLPRFANQSDFQARGFQDETRALLRYAQKSAIAQRRNVCVTLSGTGVTLTIDNGGSCNGALTLPSVPRGGTGLSATVAGFKFQPLGDTDQATNIVVTVAGTNITVDPRTGYVY